MDNDERLRCRICGFRHEDPPWGDDGITPLFEYCPCCGVESGYQDATREGAKQFREGWIARGASWDDPNERPVIWDMDEQLRHIPEAFR